MTENPFVFSAKRNVFVAASCGYLALLTSNSSTDRDISYGSVVAGCKSTCFGPNSTDDNMYGAKGILDNVCRGIHCCQTNIPSHVKDFEISFHNLEIVDRENKCNYAFLVDQYRVKSGYHESMSFDEVDDYVPVTMEWYLKYSEFQFFGKRLRNDSANHCPLHIQFGEPDQNTMKCFCKSGFRGNPYVLDGCRDINECENYKMQCGSRICVNKIGRFECIEPISKLVLIGTVGALGAFVLLVVGSFGLYKAIKNRKDAKRKQKLFKRNGGLLLQKCLSSGEASVEKTRVFNSNELDKATDHFSVNRIVGQGGHGTVYKGMLADGRIVAIKKSKIQDQEKKVTEFINEVVILSQINHRNVVKLLGCCLETEVPLLVYEFIPNGTLFEYLQNQNEEIIPLTWKLRLQIAVEIAGALSYLHSAASIPIYHRDIKSTNILLDEKYRAKIADFGTSRSVAIDQTHLTTLIYGTFGYLDPEYFQSSKFTEKSDVYSFGVVIAELLTGQKPVSLAAYFIQCMEDNRLLDSIDGRIVGNYQDIMAVANLAKRCLNSVGKNRPTMKQVAMELETIQRLVN